jgi:S-adenosylmethionine decarboxylase
MVTKDLKGFGLHLTLDGYGGRHNLLADSKLVRKVLDRLPQILRMKKISRPQVLWYDGGGKPEDCGVSGFVMVAESHIAIHTFSQKKFLTADIYSCKWFEAEKAIVYFKEAFELKKIETEISQRGLQFPRT